MKKTWRDIAFNIVSWLANVLDPPGRMSTDEKIAFSKALEEKQAANEPPYVWIDRARMPAAYEPPSPTTDGKIAAERLGIRARVTYNEMEKQTEKLKHHNSVMVRKKFITQKLDPIDTTELPRMPRKLALVRQQSYDNYLLPTDLEAVTALRMPTTWML